METATGKSFVAFGDMLGFAALVESAPDTSADRLHTVEVEWLADHGDEFRLTEASRHRLYTENGKPSLERQFLLYHWLLERAFLQAEPAFEAVVFSDSFFLSSSDAKGLLAFLGQLMADMIVNGIPVRMGVAEGSFCSTESSLVRIGGSQVFKAKFLGKGVVRSHHAESKGLKGLRIGMHPAMVSTLGFGDHVVMPVLSGQESEHCTHELNYLIPYLRNASVSRGVQRMPGDIHAAIDVMQSASDPKFLEYYAATRDALLRMKNAWLAHG